MALGSAWIWGSGDEPVLPRLSHIAALTSTLILVFFIHIVYHKLLKPAYISELSKIPAAHWTAHFSPQWMSERRKAGYESRTIYAAHQAHGPVVRLGPDEVSVMSLEGIRKIYGGGFERTRWFDEFKNYGVPNLVTTHGKEAHAKRRRMTLSSVILWSRLLPVLVNAAADESGVNFYNIAYALGAEFMSAYEFGIQNGYDLVSKGREEVRNAYLKDGERKLRVSEGEEKAKIAAEELEDQCMTMIETTRNEMQGLHEDDGAQGSACLRTAPVAFANLSEQIFEEEKHLSMRDALKLVASEMLDNIEAAREGIGIVLTYAAHELSLDTTIQTSLRMELREALGQSPAMAVQRLDVEVLRTLYKAPLLDAVVHETLRLRPPAPGPQRRWVPRSGAVINGYHLPEMTTVHVAPYCIHRAPEVFPDAERWRPERWMDRSDDSEVNANAKTRHGGGNMQSYMFAFSRGGRTCLGNNFATLVIKLVLALIYMNFETRVVDDEGIEQVDEVIGWPRGNKLILGFQKM